MSTAQLVNFQDQGVSRFGVHAPTMQHDVGVWVIANLPVRGISSASLPFRWFVNGSIIPKRQHANPRAETRRHRERIFPLSLCVSVARDRDFDLGFGCWGLGFRG